MEPARLPNDNESGWSCEESSGREIGIMLYLPISSYDNPALESLRKIYFPLLPGYACDKDLGADTDNYRTDPTAWSNNLQFDFSDEYSSSGVYVMI